MRKFILPGLTLVLILFFTGCSSQSGTSQDEYNDLQAKYEALEVENSLLEEALATTTGNEQSESDEATESDTVTVEEDTDVENMIEDLSIISAFLIWNDYYYQNGGLDQTDTEFNERLGTLIADIDDTSLQAAYYTYYKAEVAYQQVLATLPQDDSVWTQKQYDDWLAAGTKRSTALGQVGGYLSPLLESIDWFNQ